MTSAEDILSKIFQSNGVYGSQFDETNRDRYIPEYLFTLVNKQRILFYFSHRHNKISDLGSYLDSTLAIIGTNSDEIRSHARMYETGRLGSDVTSFHFDGVTGLFKCNKTDYTGIANFNTIRADVCVYKGKWQYEVMLETRGIMQLGWCTYNCRFSQEIGVGDTWTSYSYDGQRVRKWNVQNSKYGDPWLAGDVISCLIDCDEGTISFKRNGADLGVAFSNVSFGAGIAYFPAISLSQNECIRINFGATPLRYPTKGFLPFDLKPTRLIKEADYLLNIFESVIRAFSEKIALKTHATKSNSYKLLSEDINANQQTISNDSALMLIAGQVLERLTPLMDSAYVVEECLLKMLLRLCRQTLNDEHLEIKIFLDLLWSFLEPTELLDILTQIFLTLNVMYCFAPIKISFADQRQYLYLVLALLKHEDTRKRFPLFIDIKPPDSEVLKEIVPTVWNKSKSATSITFEALEQELAYLFACRSLKEDLQTIETIQVEILKLLLLPSDVLVRPPSSKFLFITKFRLFLKENLTESPLQASNQVSPGVIRNLFHRLFQVLEYYWNQYHEIKALDEGVESSLSFEQAYVPTSKFYDDNLDYFDLQRLGGLKAHLEKEYASKLITYNHTDHRRHYSKQNSSTLPDTSLSKLKTGSESLTELLDGIIFLYHIGVHKHFVKITEVTETLRDYSNALADIETKIKNCRPEFNEIMDELLRSKKIFEEQVEDLMRKAAWVVTAVFSQEKKKHIVAMHRCIHRTLQKASESGNLFTFVPEIYIDIYLNTFTALNSYFSPDDSLTTKDVSENFVEFIVSHLQDKRIINVDVRDNIVQSLSTLAFYPEMLKLLENMPQTYRKTMINALLSPYANRSWAMTNLILVRFWKGCGFGFRYSQLYQSRLLQGPRKDRIQEPCPSVLYQKEIGEYLLDNTDDAINFFNTLLNQLNWAFSEFMGMLKDLVQRPRTGLSLTIDHRQLKMCSTCFDVSVSLLRTIELSVNVAPALVLEKKSQQSEMLLVRLLQLLSQIINRLSTKNNILFQQIFQMKVSTLENIHYYPIFSAVCGILVRLIIHSSDEA
ncbi:unnamed protein product [Didymodactylos carnosus]|nr:unnamed protein product [Didymodactylos carnosus]CAF4041006.1 unnamed protein product [Didymodactylos carnosus]